jgi:hypothetical protein
MFRDALNRPKSVWRIVHRVTRIDRGEQDAQDSGQIDAKNL